MSRSGVTDQTFLLSEGDIDFNDDILSAILFNHWMDFYQTCIDTSLGQGKGLIKFR